MTDLCKINPGMVAAGIVEGSVAHVIASTWKYGNCYTNSIEIAKALGLDPHAPHQPAPSPHRFTVSVVHGPKFSSLLLRLDHPQHSGARPIVLALGMSEAEAREHAALVLAALHQATLEGDTP